ncbi:unnamed protein product [Durusdinium trenchii]|uniref:Uncharacterized protein n=1 Tax=Durusdinium trenchii TaxID=1381693 RepID=A0ABP0JDU5_9DINO
MVEVAEAEEYEKGYGSGPQGTREVNFCSIRFNPFVSFFSAVCLWCFVLYAVLDPESDAVFGEWKNWVTSTFTWLYIGSQDYWLLYLFPLVYYYGDMKLGKDDEEPEYGDLTYLAMVWCAGVAIGLIFYGASEPLIHATDGNNRHNNDGYSNDNQKALYGLHLTMFHWGFMAWIVYCLTALTMGFLAYRRGLPLCFRTTLAPVLGKATWGWIGDLLDIVTIVTIVAGLTTSLGLGARQIVSGCQRLGWLSGTLTDSELTNAACWIIGIITLCATASVVAGLEFGIKSVSYVAFMLGNFLILVVFCLDEPWYILNVFVATIGFHLQNFLETAFDTDAFAQLGVGNGQPNDGKGANPAWMDWWTIFYWGWWIAWAPFVGTFMARVSRGRTIRQVVLYTLTIPCGYAFIWFCTFGAAAIRMDRRATWLAELGSELHNNRDYFLHTDLTFRPASAGKCYDVPASLPSITGYEVNPYVSPVCNFASGDSNGYWFDLMSQYYGMGQFLTFVSIVTTVLYFITSSDSGSLVVDLIAANGREAHVVQRVFWALTEGAVAIATVASGGFSSLTGLQAVSIVMGLPFTFILMVMCTSLWRALKLEAGDMPPINRRTDWALPLYGGVVDFPEFLLTCGRCPMPSKKSICAFFTALLFPGYALFKALNGLASHEQKPMPMVVRMILAKMTQLLFTAFVALHIAAAVYEGEQLRIEGRGLWSFGWICYISMAGFVALGRHQIRRLYSIEGSGMEDFWAALLLYPQALAQIMLQIEQTPVPQDYKKPDKGRQDESEMRGIASI